jgi:hypothetical protein
VFLHGQASRQPDHEGGAALGRAERGRAARGDRVYEGTPFVDIGRDVALEEEVREGWLARPVRVRRVLANASGLSAAARPLDPNTSTR